jgi:hypothetical protein
VAIALPLSQGYTAWIDEEDAHLAAFKWCAHRVRNGRVYAVRRTPRGGPPTTLRLHRVIMGVTDPKLDVDHADGDGLNCRRDNLQVRSRIGNSRNKLTGGGPASGLPMGVHRHRNSGRYQAYITVNKVRLSCGYYDTAEAAHLARLKAELEHWGIEPRRRHLFEKAGLC